MILFHSADLIWATKIKSAADALGVPARPVRNAEMLAARLGDCQVRALLVDLEAAETAIALITQLRGSTAAAVRVVAYGPHVAVEAMAAAKAAGADVVMARGTLQARLPAVLQELNGIGNLMPGSGGVSE